MSIKNKGFVLLETIIDNKFNKYVKFLEMYNYDILNVNN